MNITSNYDSGNIEVISAENPQDIKLKIPNDTNSEHFQWFNYRVSGVKGTELKMSLTNASEASYTEGWDGYRACASYDNKNWFRVDTEYKNGELIINHTPTENSVFYSYFAPFTYEQHLELVSKAQLHDKCKLQSMGSTIEGRDIDLLIIGEKLSKKKIWIIARQHPGESMAEWYIKGLVERLLDNSDAVSASLLKDSVFYIVPNMNIDGSIAGNLRTNTLGVNYNREWQEPSTEKSPEVFYVRNMMDEVGVSMCLDIHGDEGLPYNFVSRNEGIPSYDAYLMNIEDKFIKAWQRVNPDFQTEHGYPTNEPGKANLTVGAKQIGERYGRLSLTMEMPFKDNANIPSEKHGWSPARSEKLGASVLNAILVIKEEL